MIKLRLSIVASSIFLAAGFPASARNESPPLPLIKDIPPSNGYDDRAHDIIGLHFGDTRQDATAKIRSAYAQAGLRIREKVIHIGTRDNRGNQVRFNYVREVTASSSSGEPRQYFALRFTSPVTGGRLYRIERSVTYASETPASLSEIRASIQSKYGKPTIIERYRSYEDIVYTWEKRPIVHLPEMDMQASDASFIRNLEANPCLKATRSSAYAANDRNGYKFAMPGKRVEDASLAPCIGGIAFRLSYGRADNTVSSMQTIATDYARTVIDANLLDQALANALGAKVQSIVGTGAPKL